MAHLRSLVQRCDHPGCTTRASEAIYTFRNELHSVACIRHAKSRLAMVNGQEEEYHKLNAAANRRTWTEVR